MSPGPIHKDSEMSKSADINMRRLKYISLLTLTFQNAILGLSMRYSRTRSGDMFFEGTAVLMAEVAKLVTCAYLVYRSPDEGGKDIQKFTGILYKTIILNKLDTLKVCVPSFIYLIQNNLLYVAAEHLDVATYQITYQLKILTTAIFAVLILKRTLIKTQWLSLVILVFGVVLVQMSDSKETKTEGESREQNRLLGFSSALTACVLSGLAGIYFEKILKGSTVSVWMRNIQLSLLAIPLGIFVSFFKHSEGIREKGFFFGYDIFVFYLIMLNAMGGLLVAVVVKYADNILKGFATSLAIIITCIVSIFLFGFTLSLQFTIGASMVIGSIFLYGYKPKPAGLYPDLKLPTSSKE